MTPIRHRDYTMDRLAHAKQGWRLTLQADPLEWLLQDNNPAIRYQALVDLLGQNPDEPAVAQAASQIAQMPLALYILGRQNRKGLWGEGKDYYTPKYYSTFWALSTLGDMGLGNGCTGGQLEALRIPLEYILAHQKEDGSFPRRQITTGAPEGQPPPCTQARILRFLTQFGYGAHPAVRLGLQWLFEQQRPDGSWICATGKEARHGCLRATHDFLRLAALLPDTRQYATTANAADWLIDRLLEPRVGRFKVANLWRVFSFPTFNYSVLSAADALTALGYGIEHGRLAEAGQAILDKQTEDGSWLVDLAPTKAPANFGKVGEPSKWLTLEALRVIKRLQSSGGAQRSTLTLTR